MEQPFQLRGAIPALSVPRQVSLVLNMLGFSKVQLAEILDVTRQAIYGWLKGSEPSSDHFRRLSALTNLVQEVSKETRRPLFYRFVFSPIREDLPSILELLREETWDVGALREALRHARLLTAERDDEAEREKREILSFTGIEEEERERNFEDNLNLLD